MHTIFINYAYPACFQYIIAACLGYYEALAHNETDLLDVWATYVQLHSSVNDIMMADDIYWWRQL